MNYGCGIRAGFHYFGRVVFFARVGFLVDSVCVSVRACVRVPRHVCAGYVYFRVPVWDLHQGNTTPARDVGEIFVSRNSRSSLGILVETKSLRFVAVLDIFTLYEE